MTYKKFYFLSLAVLIFASLYPVYMGITVMTAFFQNGLVDAADYPKYIIPYTPICIALFLSVVHLPVMFRICKKYTLLAVSALGTVLFFIFEILFEQIKVVEGYTSTTLPIESWQYSMCIATPEVLRSVGEPIYAQNNPVFKIHFYIIALIIIWAVINVIYGFSKMLRGKNNDKKTPLTAQLISVVLFIGLCILACFTAFYRTGSLNISALSAFLMGVFFIVFGVTAGVYAGCLFYGRKKLLSVFMPAIVSSITTLVMYIGELVLMGGVLFKFGSGFLFEPFGLTPFAIADFMIIFLSGCVTYLIMSKINRDKNQNQLKAIS